MQTQKVEKESQAYQAGGNITIIHGPSYDEINRIVESLLKINTPSIVQEASEKAIKQVEEFKQEFFSGLKDEADILRIQESLKKPRAQYLLKEGMESAAKYGDTCDLKLLVMAIKKAILENNDDNALLASSASAIIPQLMKQQIGIISVLYFVRTIGIPETTMQPYPAFILDVLAQTIVAEPENIKLSKAMKFHLVTLGICFCNEFAGDTAEDLLARRYPTLFKEQILPLVKQNDRRVKTITHIIDCFEANELSGFQLTPVGACIAYLVAKEMGSQLSDSLFGKY
nr:LPO_1073/Vpar_1526 family protein [uncultured Sphaerochaeta sp.]